MCGGAYGPRLLFPPRPLLRTDVSRSETVEAVLAVCTHPPSPVEVDSVPDATVNMEQLEEPPPEHPTCGKKKGMKKKPGRRPTKVKSAPAGMGDAASGVAEPFSMKRKRTTRVLAATGVRTDTCQED